MIPAIGYMVGLLALGQFAVWMREHQGSPLLMLFLLGLFGVIVCLIWLTGAVAESQQALNSMPT